MHIIQWITSTGKYWDGFVPKDAVPVHVHDDQCLLINQRLYVFNDEWIRIHPLHVNHRVCIVTGDSPERQARRHHLLFVVKFVVILVRWRKRGAERAFHPSRVFPLLWTRHMP